MDQNCDNTLPDQADRILSEYESTLVSIGEHLLYGVPDSLLPSPKTVMCDILGQLQKRVLAKGDASRLEHLRHACLSLANFLPAEEAMLTKRLNIAFSKGDMAFITSHEGHTAQARIRRMEEESRQYAEKFDALCNQQQSDGLLVEIDSLLNELSHKYAAPANSG